MAIYHLHAKVIQRTKGQNAVASAAYRRATKLLSTKECKVWNYSNKPNVIHSELLIPDNAPAWAKELVELHEDSPTLAAQTLWNLVEDTETRCNAQLAREFEFALPIELNQSENIELARAFIKDRFVQLGMIADFNIHWDIGNPHVHVMLTMRELNEDGFGKKVRSWNNQSLLLSWRQQWAEYANFHLKLHQHDVHIDHRSYEVLGIDLVPTIHHGGAVRDMAARGIATERMLKAHAISDENLQKIAANPSIVLKKLSHQSAVFTRDVLTQEVGRYVLPHLTTNGIQSSDTQKEVILPSQTLQEILANLEYHHSVFTEKDLARALTPYVENANSFAAALFALKNSPEVLHIGPGDDGRDRYTTRFMFNLENDIQRQATILKNRGHAKISLKKIEKILKRYEAQTGKTLTSEQLTALHHILKPTAISCLVGRAGTGKSFSLNAARAVWEAQGLTVLGIALSGVAADGLNKDAGIKSSTIESFKLQLEKGALNLSSRDVIVMDEAGMTDSLSMHFILQKVEAAHAKLVLVGDPQQLQPVGPGASFRALVECLSFAEIQTVYRQKEVWQQAATVAFSQGNIRQGLTAYQEHGCIHFEETKEATFTKLLKDWQVARTYESDLSQLLVISYTNRDVNTLNTHIRNTRMISKEINEGFLVQTAKGEIRLSIGDRILFLKNNKTLGVNNGRFATIKKIDVTESGKILRFVALLDGSNKEVIIDPTHYNHFTHGYAATVHKVQGVTVNKSFVYAGIGWNRALTYVALTRHRISTQLYSDKETHQSYEKLVKSLSRFGIKDSVLDFPYAFARRRGIEVEIPISTLSQRLNLFKESLTKKFKRLLNPYAVKETSREADPNTALQLQREDARLVASYSEAHQEAGKAYAELSLELNKLGLSQISYDEKDFEIIKSLSSYQSFQTALLKKYEMAYLIIKEPHRYKKALEIYSLNVKDLTREAVKYQAYARVQKYQIFTREHKWVYQDKMAYEIMRDIKAHYPYLKSTNVTTYLLKEQALKHLKRKLLKTLNTHEREAFRLVEKYHAISRKIGKNSETESNPKSRFTVKDFEKLNHYREELAHQILRMESQCEKALEFFKIGKASSHFNEEINNTQIQQASMRFDKLKAAATRFEIRERVNQYRTALLTSDLEKRMYLSHEILKDARVHHGAIVNLNADTKALWQVIWQDTKRYERKTYLKACNAHERIHFKTVENYVEAKRAHAAAWRELFENKATQKLDNKEFYTRLSSYATPYTSQRNKLASLILQNPAAYKEALTYFKVGLNDLKPQSAQHECELRVQSYSQEKNFLKKSEIAYFILLEPKAHDTQLKTHNIPWKEVYAKALHHEKQKLFKTLNQEDKALYRLIERYQKANKAAGETFSQYKLKNTNIKDSKINYLFSKRNYLAHRLLKSYSRELISPHLKTDKLAHQAKQHLALCNLIDAYKKEYQIAIKAIGALYKNIEGAQKEDFKNTLSSISTALSYEQQLRNVNTQYLISSKEESQFKKDYLKLNTLQVNLFKLVSLKNLNINKGEISVSHAPRASAEKIDLDKLKSDLNQNAASVALHYLGTPIAKSSSSLRYGSNKGSLSITIRGEKQGLWKDFQTGLGGDMLSLIQDATKLPFKEVLKEATQFLSGGSSYLSSSTLTVKKEKSTKALDTTTFKKIKKAQLIFNTAKPIIDTLAHTYLKNRGINASLSSRTFRYHPHLKNWMTHTTHPALIVAARDSRGQICGVQAIFLNEDGSKANLSSHTKLSRGIISEGALVHKGTSGIIAFAEGPETALSVSEAQPSWTVYATFSVSSFDKVPLKVNAKNIVLCVDNDGVNSSTQKAVEKAADSLSQKGIEVYITELQLPSNHKKWDFNDELTHFGVAHTKGILESKLLHKKGMTEQSLLKEMENFLENHKVEVKPSPTLESLLKPYLELELEQTRLVRAMHSHALKNPEKEAEYFALAQNNFKKLQTVCVELFEHSLIQAEIEKTKRMYVLSIDEESLSTLYEKLPDGLNPKQIKTILNGVEHHVGQVRARQQQLSLKNKQNRGIKR